MLGNNFFDIAGQRSLREKTTTFPSPGPANGLNFKIDAPDQGPQNIIRVPTCTY
jgi:hypothetical protein